MEIFIARQPIYDRKEEVVFYELLFRSCKENVYNCIDGDLATYQVMTNAFINIGINNITNGKKVFINFTENLIREKLPLIAPNELLVVEILETVEPTEEVLAACQEIKSKGYTIVLDDFIFKEKYRPLIKMADIIKIDFTQTDKPTRRKIVKAFQKHGIKFLAEKIETKEEYQEALDIGYDYFQGYFFSRPEMLSEKELPMNYNFTLSLLSTSLKKKVELEEIEEIVKRDVSLSYKLLRVANSSYFGFQRKITSIKDAILLFGTSEISRWLFLLHLKTEKNSAYSELLEKSVIRAKMGEKLSQMLNLHHITDRIFLMEILSDIPKIFNQPMASVISDLSLDDELKDALLGVNNDLGILHTLLDSYLFGDFDKFEILSTIYNFRDIELNEIYLDSVAWVNNLFV